MHIVAAKAVCFGEALKPAFRDYARQIIDNARVLAEVLAGGGLRLISGGTENHLMLVDVTPLEIGGKLAEQVLEKCGITVNKNMIPYDERKPLDPSGIRIGTPALTTRGMGPDEMRIIGGWILKALKSPADEQLHQEIRGDVFDLCEQFPVPASRLAEV
jgi:glycine hydroxymethyltransferase